MKRLVALGLMGLLGLGLWACDSVPSGPGEISGTVQSAGATLGAVVLEVVAADIEGFSGSGDVTVFWAPQDDPVVHRVVVVGKAGGKLAFTAQSRERANRMPKALVVSAVDVNNLPIPVTPDITVSFSR